MASKSHTVVIGAGVIGLQTALLLLQAGHSVTVVATHFPGDVDPALVYTSPKAGAHWRSQSTDPFVHKADKETYLAWLSLVRSKGASETGLALTPSYYFWEEEGAAETVNNFRGLWWKDYVLDFRVLPKQELPEGVSHGVAYTTFAINPTQYMRYLLRECQQLGVETVRRKVASLGEAATLGEDVVAVVNCTGISARELVGDENVYPIKGQTVLVRGESKTNRFVKTKSGWQDAVLRRPGEGTILGVSKDKDDWSNNIDQNLTKMILERCKRLAPELLVDGKFDVVRPQIGRRPARKGGIRIEIERLDVGGKDLIVCHHYGHGGTG
ncbi:FAD dependent oxidoreductase [Sphaerosporella brunnea]|uniref:FAD dependent oxidoreductase n=1 Tax=Sphaerosporella brunnea TaxID=1250544 RepID=A0A5J5F0F5_9PEZI|nr:FAD dependent oxidoreductase [Sphaerosporella brunnea]